MYDSFSYWHSFLNINKFLCLYMLNEKVIDVTSHFLSKNTRQALTEASVFQTLLNHWSQCRLSSISLIFIGIIWEQSWNFCADFPFRTSDLVQILMEYLWFPQIRVEGAVKLNYLYEASFSIVPFLKVLLTVFEICTSWGFTKRKIFFFISCLVTITCIFLYAANLIRNLKA